MNCKSTREMLSAYLDRELAPQERNAIRAHLADCDCCRTEERDLRALKGLLLGVRAPEPAADFEGRLMARLYSESVVPVRPRLTLPTLRPHAVSQFGGLAVAAAIVATVIVRVPQTQAATTPLAIPSHRTAVAQPADFEGSMARFMAYDGADGFAGGTRMATSNDAP